jgi:hypothetical protein
MKFFRSVFSFFPVYSKLVSDVGFSHNSLKAASQKTVKRFAGNWTKKRTTVHGSD